jgi:hypothetical protein
VTVGDRPIEQRLAFPGLVYIIPNQGISDAMHRRTTRTRTLGRRVSFGADCAGLLDLCFAREETIMAQLSPKESRDLFDRASATGLPCRRDLHLAPAGMAAAFAALEGFPVILQHSPHA